jgi:hypothetical protein
MSRDIVNLRNMNTRFQYFSEIYQVRRAGIEGCLRERHLQRLLLLALCDAARVWTMQLELKTTQTYV